jgi:hypothetical protein
MTGYVAYMKSNRQDREEILCESFQFQHLKTLCVQHIYIYIYISGFGDISLNI